MRYIIDHDYHIHSHLSLCSSDPEQTTERILRYAKECGLKSICVTDHYWDETVPGASPWYQQQDTGRVRQSLPLPQEEGIEFLFGCEIDMDRFGTIGLAPEHFDDFDFVVIPTTHLHMMGFTLTEEEGATAESRAKLWISRLDNLLSQDLTFHKIGIAHLTCSLIDPRSREDYLRVLGRIPTAEMERLFTRAAEVGVGIELNADDMLFSEAETERVLRPYRIAKCCGCKFYLGSDAHHPKNLDEAIDPFIRAISLLHLEETDKFHIERA